MCGILGVFDARASCNSQRFDAALDLLTHRGPDDRGVFAQPGILLGHRRLSILDLSTAGHQPMIDPGSGTVIVFNGEIYNYLELRAELEARGEVFRTRTDTEVLLKAYLAWGEACLQRLNGMWAFAIWEPVQRRLFFARDRFGVKPFYYHISESRFLFASEPKALLAIDPALRAVDGRTLFRFLACGELYVDDGSFYHGVKLLAPAHRGEYQPDTGRMELRRYWDYPDTAAAVIEPRREISAFTELFEDAVRIRLRSDVPVGITLSGGLDSTAVLAAAEHSAPGQRVCFTSVYGADGRGEASWARLAAGKYNLAPIEVEASATGWLDTLHRIAWHMDGPGYSPAVYALWCLMAAARRRNVPVLLEGQGADEALGGYPQYGVLDLLARLRRLARSPERKSWQSLRQTWSGLTSAFSSAWVLRWLAREAFPFLVPWYRMRVGAISVLRPEFCRQQSDSVAFGERKDPRHMDEVTCRLWRDHSRDILPGLLHYGDAISMSHGIESRLPFMDYRLVEWIFSRPATIKVRNGSTKWLVREYLSRHGQPTIAARPDKLGYPTPADQWLRADDGRLAREILLASDAAIAEYCDPMRVRRLIDYHVRDGGGAGNHLYRLLSTEMWLRTAMTPPRTIESAVPTR